MKIDKLHAVLLLTSVACGTVAMMQTRATAAAERTASAHRKVSEAAFIDSSYRAAERLAVSVDEEQKSEMIERLRQRRALNIESLSPTELAYFRTAEAKAIYTIGQHALE